MKRFFVTTSIAYVNAPPHIGYALELIQADVIARYRRLLGDSVFFSTGVDEHGIKIARRAEELGVSPRAFVDANARLYRALRRTLDLSWDVYVRTSDAERHWPTARGVWKELYRRGDLYRKIYEGTYCVGHEAFVTEKDLDAGRCRIHKTVPEVVKEENWFFRLSRYVPRIRALLEKGTVRIFPASRVNETLSLLREGVGDVSFSRPRAGMPWGIPAPNDSTQTMYVWVDALTNYLSALSWNGRGRRAAFWPPDVQVIGKDILRFHAIIWLGMLLSLRRKLPGAFFVHGFITVNGEKMSKSIGNVVDPVDAARACGSDALRYYLLREVSPDSDGDFSYEKLKARYNGDLAHGLGNLVARVAALGEQARSFPFSLRGVRAETRLAIRASEKRYRVHMGTYAFNEALADAWQLIGYADRLINQARPWGMPPEDAVPVIRDAAAVIFSLADLIEPFLPKTAPAIRRQFSLKRGKLTIKKGESLFPRLS